MPIGMLGKITYVLLCLVRWTSSPSGFRKRQVCRAEVAMDRKSVFQGSSLALTAYVTHPVFFTRASQ